MKRILLLIVIAFAFAAPAARAQLVLPIAANGTVQAPIDTNGWKNFKVTLTQNVTPFQFTGIPTPAQANVMIIWTQNATGGFTVTYGSYTAPGGQVIKISNGCTPSAIANATTVCLYDFDNTTNTWLGVSGGSSGGGSAAGPAGQTQQSNGGGGFVAGNTNDNTTLPGYFYVAESLAMLGPDPWISANAFYVTPTLTDFGATGACVNGNPSITFSAGSFASFFNNMGILLPGCGPTPTGIAAPASITVNPVLIAGLDLFNDTVPAPSAGSTVYNYVATERDKLEGMSVASGIGTTATGWPLGTSSGTIGNASRSGQTVTVTGISPAILCAPGALLFIINTTDASFSTDNVAQTCGSSTVASSTLTYTQGWSSTKPIPCNSNGSCFSTNAATGGTITTYSGNQLLFPAHGTNGYEYGIYAPGGAFKGWTRPQELSWVDFGVAAPSLGPWFPSSAPSVVTNQSLATTIVSGAPTATVVLATAPSQTTSTAALLDNAPNYQAACTAATSLSGTGPGALWVGTGAPNTKFYFNSHVTCPGSLTLFPHGIWVLNETQEYTGTTVINGILNGSGGSNAAFSWNQGTNINVVDAFPGWILPTPSHISTLEFIVNANGLGVTYPSGGAFNSSMDRISCIIQGTDTTGQCVELYGQANFVADFITMETNAGTAGYSPVQIFLSRNDVVESDNAGDISLTHPFFVGRGFGHSSFPVIGSNAKILVLNSYNQNVVNSPVFMIGKNNQPSFVMIGGQNDSSPQGMLGSLGTSLSANLTMVPDNSAEAGGRSGIVSGQFIPNLHVDNVGGQPWLNTATPVIGQNLGVIELGVACEGINMLALPCTTYSLDNNGNIAEFGYLDVAEIAAPGNPPSGSERWYANLSTHLFTCTTSSGGNCLSSGVTSVSGDGTFFTNSSSIGAVTLTLGNAPAFSVWGNNTGSSAGPGYTTNPIVGTLVANAAGAASTPGLSVTGTPFAGTGTTSTPQLYINNSGSAPSTWSTNGTSLGINCAGGNAFETHASGGGALFTIACAGGQVNALGAIIASGQIRTGVNYAFSTNHVVLSASVPTIGTCGTTPSIASNNGTATFVVNVGTGGTASTCTVTMPAATAGWSCMVAPTGAPQAAAITYAASTSTTQITLTNYTASTGVALAWASGQTLNVNCIGY